MQSVVIDKPYQFVPAHRGNWWPRFLQRIAPGWLNRKFGISEFDCRGVERLQESLAAGHGVLLAPNHCRPCDPFVVAVMIGRAGVAPFTMASWHLFKQGWFQAWVLRHGSVFSIYREGVDRTAIGQAIDILANERRPLVVFPEGAVSRTNDRLNSLMDGVAFMARSAAKKKEKQQPAGKVVIHPVALKYHFRGDIEAALRPTLAEIEHRLAWRIQDSLPLVERIYKVGEALLCLKELEYLGRPQAGPHDQRLSHLIDHLLVPLEAEWANGKAEATIVGRVKKLRTAILPDMVQGRVDEEERQRRWRQLADIYLAQQLSCYPPDYLRSNPTPERLLETVERFEEDLTDECRAYRPLVVTVQVGEAIAVSPERQRGAEVDPLMAALESQLGRMIDDLGQGV